MVRNGLWPNRICKHPVVCDNADLSKQRITPGRRSVSGPCTLYGVPSVCSTHVLTIERNEPFSAEIGRPFIDGVRKRMLYPIQQGVSGVYNKGKQVCYVYTIYSIDDSIGMNRWQHGKDTHTYTHTHTYSSAVMETTALHNVTQLIEYNVEYATDE